MSFDINPLVHQMHLKQLDHEAARIHRYKKTAGTEDRQPQKDISKHRSWICKRIGFFWTCCYDNCCWNRSGTIRMEWCIFNAGNIITFMCRSYVNIVE